MTDVTRPAVPLLAGAGRSPGKRRQVHVTGGIRRKRGRERSDRECERKGETEKEEERDSE